MLFRSEEDLSFSLRPMNIRGDQQFTEFRKILQEAFNTLPNEQHRCVDRVSRASVADGIEAQHVLSQAGANEPVTSPRKAGTLHNFDEDNILLRVVDLVPPVADPLDVLPQGDDQINDKAQHDNREGSDTLVGETGRGSSSGKRKAADVQEDGDDSPD